MSFIRTSINRPVTISMITIGVVAFGLIALLKLPINLLPDLSYPTLTLETRYPGAAPEEVEYLITRQIEENVAVIPNIKRISSSSKPELSQVTIEFQWGNKMDFAILDVSKKVDQLRLPDGVEKPRILRYDPNQDPIMKVSITSPKMPLTELRYFGEEDLKKRLDGIPGLASVKVLGGREEVVEVYLDEAALKHFKLSIEDVNTRLKEENINRAGGSLYENEARYLVRTLNEFKNLEDIGSTIVSRSGDKKVYLREVANINFGNKDKELVHRIQGEEGIELAFYKEGDANTVQVSKRLEKAIAGLKEQFKDKIGMEVTYRGATFIQDAVEDVKNNAIFGGLIAIFVLFLFLRDLRGTIIVGFSIPISVFVTFFLMLQFGVSLNIMSLGGLALGIGMLVDNSIVVLESIFVQRFLGDEPKEAAAKGAISVSGAVVASTLTTVVVFLPVLFIDGVAGQLFRDLGTTVSFSLLASLVVSLTLMPMLFALLSGSKKKVQKQPKITRDLEFEAYSNKLYSKLLSFSLRHRGMVLLVCALALGQGFFLYKKMGLNLVPELSQGDYYVQLEMDEGTPIDKTDQAANEIEQHIRSVKGVNLVFSTVGEFNQGVESRSGENLAQVNFSLDPELKNSREVLDQIRQELAKSKGLNYQLGSPSFFSFRTPIELEIYNDSQAQVETLARAIVAEMEKLDSLADIRSTVAMGNPEVHINFKRETMSQYGLSIGAVAQLLRDKIQGNAPTRLTRAGQDLDLLVRLRNVDRHSLEQLYALTVGYKDGKPIYLSSVANILETTGPSQIKRIGQKRCAVISANVRGKNLSAAQAELDSVLAPFRANDPETKIISSGQSAEMGESFVALIQAILLAVFLVYLVMASQFESLLHPFLILFTIPMGLVGGIVALYLTGLEINVIALIGLVMLAGIVVNNAIVLIDYLNQLRSEGVPLYRALILAGNRRIRPIFMTTSTTVLGLLPMAFMVGSGAEMRKPLAITVIGGLVFSTILTLIIIPVLYSFVTKGSHLPVVEKVERESSDWNEEVTA